MRKKLFGMFICTNATGTVHIPAQDGWNPVSATQNRGRGSFEVRGLFGTGTTTVNLAIQTATDITCLFARRAADGAAYNIATNPGPDGWQGPIIPLGKEEWIKAAEFFQDGTDGEKVCAAARMAAVLLHEMVHICGDSGAALPDGFAPTGHDCASDDPSPQDVPRCCWDECRVIQSSLWWALAQRYPCVSEGEKCCYWTDPVLFMHAAAGEENLEQSC